MPDERSRGIRRGLRDARRLGRRADRSGEPRGRGDGQRHASVCAIRDGDRGVRRKNAEGVEQWIENAGDVLTGTNAIDVEFAE